MENSDDNNDEDETEWKTSFPDFTVAPNPVAVYGTGLNRLQTPPQRVILHFDLDCFYAQVEMIRNPALRNVPLGIQQKYILVTCNYVAREQGVTKLMSVVDAREKCPQLVLVKGEDLTHYRDMSYDVTELLTSYCPLVERLGFDENYVDVTEMVERRLTHCSSFEGHVYNRSGAETNAGDHRRLAVGSHIAAELRTAIYSTLGLTGCAGVATNKLLSKLVSGTFKPNQQTTLLPQDVDHIMGHLGGLRRIPGVGHQTSKRLRALGLETVQDLQLFPLADLVKEFGAPTGQRLKNLSLGVDGSPAVPTGAPQSLSDEDSFKKISTTREVVEKTKDLLTSLVERMQKDGRQPHTFRLTLRRYSADNKWFSRESRQCPIPNHIGQKVVSGSTDATAHLVTMAMKLFNKMVDGSAAFHLTLLNVCFTNLPPARGTTASGKGAITSFFTLGSSPRSPILPRTNEEHPPSRPGHLTGSQEVERNTQSMITQHDFQMKTPVENTAGSKTDQPASVATKSPVVSPGISDHHGATRNIQAPSEDDWTTGGRTFKLPPNVDLEVFRELPEDIQRELLSPAFTRTRPASPASATSRPVCRALAAAVPTPLPLYYRPETDPASPPCNPAPPPRDPASQSPLRSPVDSHPLPVSEGSASDLSSSDALPTATEDSRTPLGPTSTVPGEAPVADPQRAPGGGRQAPCSPRGVPGDVDPTVFSELPPEVQRELMVAWRQQKPVLKAPSSVKPERKFASKYKKAVVKGGQQNDLTKYFKPS